MTALAKHPRMPPISPETCSEPRPLNPPKKAEPAGPKVYWGDRLALKFWLFCFGLMFAINLIEALHRLVLFLMGRSLAP
jgi:hypothetical protein